MKNYTTIRLLTFTLTLFAFNYQLSAQDIEPNDAIATASSVALNGSVNGDLFINPANDANDYYELTAIENGSLTATADIAEGLSLRLRIYNANGSQIVLSSSLAGPDILSLTADCLPDATYYVRVERMSGSGTYTLSNTFSVPVLEEDLEPNNLISSTQTFLDNNDAVTGHLGYGSDNSDYFGLLPGDDGNITISAELNESLTGRLRLLYKNGSQLSISTSGNETITTTANCLANDTIYAFVERISGCGSYTLNFQTDSPPANEQDVEPNNSIIQANVFLENNATTEGRLGYNGVGISDNADYFGLLPGDDGNITISAVFDETMTGRLRLLYKNGSQLNISNAGIDISTTANCIANDTIYAFVERISGCGSYILNFQTDSPPANEQDVEPNNSIAQTNVFLENNASTEGRLGYNGVGINDNLDFFGLIAGDDGNVTISATFDETMTGRLRIQYKNGAQIAISNSGTDISTTANCIANDTIYAFVERISGCGSYNLNFQTDSPPAHEQDVEPNNTIVQANVFLENGASSEGRLGYNGVGISDNIDFFGLIPGDDGNVTISAMFDETMTGRLRIYSKNNSQLAISVVGIDITTTANCVANDTVYAFVELISGCGSYDLQFLNATPTYGNDVEPNNTITDSNPMLTAEKVEGHLGHSGVGINDVGDYYSFEVVQPPFELDAKIIPADGLTIRLRLLNNSGSQLLITGSSAEPISLAATITDAGTYHVLVERIGGCGSYQLGDLCGLYPTVEATPPGPLLKCPAEPVDLLATSGLTSYAWYNGAEIVGIDQALAANSSGDYSVIGYDINGCSDTSNVVVISALNCDDGDPCTDDFCDTETGCSNVFSGDDDGDGTCNNLDLCPNDPDKIEPGNCGCNEPEPGATCDDGDPETVGDIVQEDCTCAGVLEFDCPELEANFGDDCDDGDGNTIGDEIQEDCTCAGVLEFDCPALEANIGDECNDGDSDTEMDVVGDDCVCAGTVIDTDGDGITDSQDNCPADGNEDQSDVDQDGLGDVCDPDIDGDGVMNEDDCSPFDSDVYAGATCDDGNAETINDQYDENCICVGQIDFDCPDLQANIGDECDDGNDDLIPGIVNENCVCEAQEIFDCPALQANIGDDCDDGDELTFFDEVNSDCVCVGITYDCPELMANIGDECDDGNDDLIPGIINENCFCEAQVVFDCPELQANVGDVCDDGLSNTENDEVGEDCVCAGTPISVGCDNDEAIGAIPISMGNIWGVPGWDSFEVGCATPSVGSCQDERPVNDTWYSFIAEAENQGILARANPANTGASLTDVAIQLFDSELEPLTGISDGTCAVDRSCFNNYGPGQIERAVATGLTIGDLYYYRVYDVNNVVNSGSNWLDTKVKTYAAHPILEGCGQVVSELSDSWTIESPANLYNIPPVPVFNVRMVLKDADGNIVAVSSENNPLMPGGLTFTMADFGFVPDGAYMIHAQNEVKMMANGCISAFWSQLGPGCPITVELNSDTSQELPNVSILGNTLDVYVYPNPNTGEVAYIGGHFESDKAQKLTIQIFDLFGKRVYAEQFVQKGSRFKHALIFDQKLSAGMYMIRSEVAGITNVQKLIIK